MPKLTTSRLRWLLASDPLVAYFWLLLHDWSIPNEMPELRLYSEVLRNIERWKFPALRGNENTT